MLCPNVGAFQLYDGQVVMRKKLCVRVCFARCCRKTKEVSTLSFSKSVHPHALPTTCQKKKRKHRFRPFSPLPAHQKLASLVLTLRAPVCPSELVGCTNLLAARTLGFEGRVLGGCTDGQVLLFSAFLSTFASLACHLLCTFT